MRSFRSTWSRFEFRKPRNPLARVAIVVLAVCVLAMLLVVGLFAGLAMLAFGLAVRIYARIAAARRGAAPSAARAGAIDGEFSVVTPERARLASH
jgi:hypothetical protein